MRDLDGDMGSLDFFEEQAAAVEEIISFAKPWMRFHKFNLVKTVAEVRELVDRCIARGVCSLDLETQGFDNRVYFSVGQPYTVHKIVGYCIEVDSEGFYIPVRHNWEKLYSNESPNVDDIVGTELEIKRLCVASQPVGTPEALEKDPFGFREFLVPSQVKIKFWNAKFDQEFLYPITGIDYWHPDSFEDGMLMAYVLVTENELGLKVNAFERISVLDPDTGISWPYEMIEFSELFPKNTKSNARKFADLEPKKTGPGWNLVLYGCSDAICTGLLVDKMMPDVSQKRFVNIYRLEKQVAQVVRWMERFRVHIDKDAILVVLREAERELEHYQNLIQKEAQSKGFTNFNPGSTEQLGELLFEKHGLDLKPKPEKTTEGQYKTDEKTLAKYLDVPNPPLIVDWVIKYRQISKIKGTYLENLANNTDDFGDIRLKFNQTGAATGRFSASSGEPEHGYAGVPIQGIPAKNDPSKPKVAHSMRKMFVARPGYKYVKIDYASQELRIATSVTGEPKWIAEYEKELTTGIPADLHFLTAKAFFPTLTPNSPDFKLRRGQGKCVHPDTLVLSGEGYVCMSDIGPFSHNPDEFNGVRGVTVDGKNVVATYNGGVKPLFHVVCSQGVLTCTEEHRFQLADGTLVRTGDLKVGTVLEPVQFEELPPGQVLPNAIYIESYSDFIEAGTRAALLQASGQKVRVGLSNCMVSIKSCDDVPVNEVLSIIPAGVGPCLDITMEAEPHLYRANGFLTHNTANFALIYGGGVGAVQRATGCDEVEGARLLQSFLDALPVYAKWTKNQEVSVVKNLGVQTAFGRFLAIPDAAITAEQIIQADIERQQKAIDLRAALGKGSPKEKPTPISAGDANRTARSIRSSCQRKSKNYPIQGSGADILKIVLVMLRKEIALRKWCSPQGEDLVRLLMTVHDEIVFEVKTEMLGEVVPVLKKIMEHPYRIVGWRIPLVAEPELGDSWQPKTDWIHLLHGSAETPDYMVGQTVPVDPIILVNKGTKFDDGSEERITLPVAPKEDPTKEEPKPSAIEEGSQDSVEEAEEDIGLDDNLVPETEEEIRLNEDPNTPTGRLRLLKKNTAQHFLRLLDSIAQNTDVLEGDVPFKESTCLCALTARVDEGHTRSICEVALEVAHNLTICLKQTDIALPVEVVVAGFGTTLIPAGKFSASRPVLRIVWELFSIGNGDKLGFR